MPAAPVGGWAYAQRQGTLAALWHTDMQTHHPLGFTHHPGNALSSKTKRAAPTARRITIIIRRLEKRSRLWAMGWTL